MELKILSKINDIIKTVCIATLTIVAVFFFYHYSQQAEQKKAANQVLESFYVNKLNTLYINCYDVDMDGQLIMGQYAFEKERDLLRNQMLNDGFDRGHIEKMEDEARKIGQEARRRWDNLRKIK